MTTTNTQQPLFTLLLLIQVPSGYIVAQTIKVAQNSSCSIATTCCGKQQLYMEQQFQVPSPSTAFGIFTYRTGGILAYRPGQERNTSGFQINSDRIQSSGEIIVYQQERKIINYQRFNFVIGILVWISTILYSSLHNSSSAELTDNNTQFGTKIDKINKTTDPLLNPMESLSTTGIVGLAVGCLVAVVITTCISLSLGIGLCFKARASKNHERHQSNADTVDRNSQADYDYISIENINGPTLTSSNPTVTAQVQCNGHRWRKDIFPGNKHGNLAYNVSNLSTNRVPQQEHHSGVNFELNAEHWSSQEIFV